MKFLYNIKTPATPGVFMLYSCIKDHFSEKVINALFLARSPKQ